MADTTDDGRGARTFALAERVRASLERHGASPVLIGAIALAQHRYVRATVDVDLAANAPLGVLRAVRDELAGAGFDARLEEPDPQDPLGGVLTVEGRDFDPVQVVSFEGKFPALVTEALAHSKPFGDPAFPVVVPDLPRLIAFKLYAGGRKSELDILELIDRNPDLDLAELRAFCKRLNLDRELMKILDED